MIFVGKNSLRKSRLIDKVAIEVEILIPPSHLTSK
jgi:hypothetical protein